MAKILLSGDRQVAGQYTPLARRILENLRRNMSIGKLKQSLDDRDFAGASIRVTSEFGLETISIYGKPVSGVIAYVVDMIRPDTQVYNSSGKWQKSIDTQTTQAINQHWGIAYDNQKLYITNWWYGNVEVYDLQGNFITKYNMAKQIYGTSENAPISVVSVNGGFAAVLVPLAYSFCCVFDSTDFKLKYYVPVPLYSSSSHGICLDNGVLYVVFDQTITITFSASTLAMGTNTISVTYNPLYVTPGGQFQLTRSGVLYSGTIVSYSGTTMVVNITKIITALDPFTTNGYITFGYARIRSFVAETGAAKDTLEDDITIGNEISGISVNNGLLYAVDGTLNQVLVYDTTTLKLVKKVDMSAYVQSEEGSTSSMTNYQTYLLDIKASKNSIWVTVGRPYQFWGADWTSPYATHLSAWVYEFDKSFNLISKNGGPVSNTVDNEFICPTGLAIQEAA